MKAAFISGNRRSELAQGQVNTVRGWFAPCHNSLGSPSLSWKNERGQCHTKNVTVSLQNFSLHPENHLNNLSTIFYLEFTVCHFLFSFQNKFFVDQILCIKWSVSFWSLAFVSESFDPHWWFCSLHNALTFSLGL